MPGDGGRDGSIDAHLLSDADDEYKTIMMRMMTMMMMMMMMMKRWPILTMMMMRKRRRRIRRWRKSNRVSNIFRKKYMGIIPREMSIKWSILRRNDWYLIKF